MNIITPREIRYNVNAGEALLDLVESLGASRILIVSDPVIARHHVFEEVVKLVDSRGLSYEVFKDVEPEPSLETVERVAEEARVLEADLFVAIGGGSSIDAAKAGLVLYEKPSMNIEELSPLETIGIGRRSKIVAIPSTSGTGSDASFGVVITKIVSGKKRKIALGSYELVPYATILDPRLPATMPRDLTRNTALDALSHAVEAYVAVMATPYTDSLSEKVVATIFRLLPRVLENPTDLEARARIHLAATMAGIAFTNAGLGVAHAIAHAIGPRLKLHHGLAVSLALPYVVEYNFVNSEEAKEKYTELSRRLSLWTNTRNNLPQQILRFYEKIGHPRRIRDLPSPPPQSEWKNLVEEISQEAMEDSELAFNPAPVGPEEIKSILNKMY